MRHHPFMRNVCMMLFFISVPFYCCAQNAAPDEKVRTEIGGFKWKLLHKDGRVGIQTPDGKELIPPLYFKVGYLNGYIFGVDRYSREAIYDRRGYRILPPGIYHGTKIIKGVKGRYLQTIDYAAGYGVFSAVGRPIVPCVFEQPIQLVSACEKDFFFAIRNNSYSVYSSTGKLIIPSDKYNLVSLEEIDSGTRLLCKENGIGYSVRDLEGKELLNLPGVTEMMYSKECKSYIVTMGTKGGAVNEAGEWIMPPQALPELPKVEINEHFRLVTGENGLYGIKDAKGKIIVPEQYDYIDFRDKPVEHFVVVKGFLRGLFLPDGTHMIPDEYHQIGLVDEYITVRRDNTAGLFNRKGKELIPVGTYNQALPLKGDYFAVQKDGCYGVADIRGCEIIPTVYDDIGFVEDNQGGKLYFLPMYDDRVALFNNKGEQMIPPLYDGYKIRNEDGQKYFLIGSGLSVGVADLAGNLIISPDNFSTVSYKKGRYVAQSGPETYYISKKGEILEVKNVNKEREQFLEAASKAFAQKDYKSAAKNWTGAINIRPDAVSYYNRGASYFNMRKYDEAISDCSACLSLNPSRNTESMAQDVRRRAQIRKEELRQQRAETAQFVVMAILGIAVTTSRYIVNQPYYSNTPSTGSGYSGSSYYYDDTSDSSLSSSSSSSFSSSSSVREQKTSEKRICGACQGKGFHVKYTAGYGLAKNEYCSRCGKSMGTDHYHASCMSCNGSGYK